MKKEIKDKLSSVDPSVAIQMMAEMLEELYKENKKINRVLTGIVAEQAVRKTKRINSSERQVTTAPTMLVHTYSIVINNGVYRQWEFEEYSKFQYVCFYKTNVPGCVAMQFLNKECDQSAPIYVPDATRQGQWQINSTSIVNTVFGGVPLGSEARFYNACKVDMIEGYKNIALLYDNKVAQKIFFDNIKVEKIIHLKPKTNRLPAMSITKGRTRFNNSLLAKLIDVDPDRPVYVHPEYTSDGATLEFYNSGDTVTFDDRSRDYMLTFGQNRGSGTWEICNLKFQKELGINVAQASSFAADIEILNGHQIRVFIKAKQN